MAASTPPSSLSRSEEETVLLNWQFWKSSSVLGLNVMPAQPGVIAQVLRQSAKPAAWLRPRSALLLMSCPHASMKLTPLTTCVPVPRSAHDANEVLGKKVGAMVQTSKVSFW
jgi:hypothetical protein